MKIFIASQSEFDDINNTRREFKLNHKKEDYILVAWWDWYETFVKEGLGDYNACVGVGFGDSDNDDDDDGVESFVQIPLFNIHNKETSEFLLYII